ncbi:MAG: PASTA domain-containing protein [Pseudomonadota bacterium]
MTEGFSIRTSVFIWSFVLVSTVPLANAQESSASKWWEEMQSGKGHVSGDLSERFSLDDPQATTDGSGQGQSPDTETQGIPVAGTQGQGRSGTSGQVAGTGSALDPNNPNTAQWIRYWIDNAEPPPNATDGARLNYTLGGRMVGWTPTGTIESPHETGNFNPVDLWTNWRKLDSVDHCTMEEFVTASVSGDASKRCTDRYLPEVKDWVGWQASKARSAVGQLSLKAIFKPAGSAPDAARAGTVASHKPTSGSSLSKGQPVTLMIYSKPVETVAVPDLIGQPASGAKRLVASLGLKVAFKTGPTANNSQDTGKVSMQIPLAGSTVKKGAQLQLTVLRPPSNTVTVPTLVSSQVDEVVSRIRDAGLVPQILTEPPGATLGPSATVTALVPPSGVQTRAGGTVQVLVSVPQPTLVTIPDVIGASVGFAKTQFEGAGLRTEVVEVAPAKSEEMEGTVQVTIPGPGANVETGELVRIEYYGQYIVPKVEIPALSGLAIDEAVSKLSKVGLSASVDRSRSPDSEELAGTVLSTEPATGTSVEIDQKVTIVAYGQYEAPPEPVIDANEIWTSPWYGEIRISEITMDGRPSSLAQLFELTEDKPEPQDEGGSIADIPGAAVDGALEGIAMAIKVGIGVLEQGIPISIIFVEEGSGYRLDVPGDGKLAEAWKKQRNQMPLFYADGSDALSMQYLIPGTEFGVRVRIERLPPQALSMSIVGNLPNVDEEKQHLFKVLGFKMGGKLKSGIVTIEELKELMAERVMISARKYAPDLVPMLEEEMRKIP